MRHPPNYFNRCVIREMFDCKAKPLHGFALLGTANRLHGTEGFCAV